MAEAVESPGPEVSTSVSPSVSPSVRESPSVSPTPSPSPSPTAFESYPGVLPTADPESAGIIAGWQEYQRVYEKFAMAPNEYSDFTETQYVTTGHEAGVILDRISGYRENGLRLVGGRAFRQVSVGEVEEQPDGTATAQVTYCLDLNDVQIEDVSTGQLVEREGIFQEIAYMRRLPDASWRVEGLDTLEECA